MENYFGGRKEGLSPTIPVVVVVYHTNCFHQKYEEQAGEAKSKWEEEVKKYKENKVQDMEEEEGSEKEEEHNIKRPRTCFIIYNAAKREEVKESLGSEATTKDIVKKLSEMWNALSKEEKQVRSYLEEVAQPLIN